MLKQAFLVVGLLSSFAVACSSTPGRVGTEASEVRAQPQRMHMVCREYDRGTSKMKQRTIVLQQTDDLGLAEGKKLAFTAEIYEGASVLPQRETRGTVETEDVFFSFTSEDGKLGFHTYFDEVGESSLTLDGQHVADFVCHRADYVCADYDRSSDKVGETTVVLSNRGEGEVSEGRPHPFAIDIYAGAETWNPRSAEGTVETEDVYWAFTSSDRKIGFNMYLDEMTESELTIDGHGRGDFVCR